MTATARTVLAALLVAASACGGAPKPPLEPDHPPVATVDAAVTADPVATVAAKPGPDGFPLPLDAEDGQPVPEGGGKLTVFEVARGKDAVVAEVKELLAAAGWSVDGEEVSPRGAVRLDVTKDGGAYKVRFTGDDTRTAIILTTP